MNPHETCNRRGAKTNAHSIGAIGRCRFDLGAAGRQAIDRGSGVAGRRLLPLALAGLVAACQTPGPDIVTCGAPLNKEAKSITGDHLAGSVQGPVSGPVALNRVLFTDPSARNAVAIQSVGTRRTPTQTLEVSARLINCARTPYVARMRVTLYDSNQQLVEPPTPWKEVILSPGSMGHYVQQSTSNGEISSFLIELGKDGG